jgi:hypothetical protein
MSFDPSIGRWVSEDPIGFTAADPNLYRYNGNNPTNATDPSGLLEVDDNPKNPKIAALRDVNVFMEYLINRAVVEAKRQYPTDPAKGVAAVYAALATDNVFQRTSFETGLQALLARPSDGDGPPLLKKKGQSYYQIPRGESRYGKVPVTPPPEGTKVPFDQIPFAWQSSLAIANTFTPVIKVSGVPIGLDKWGHFFQQGYWLFKASSDAGIWDKGFRDQFSTYMEGGPDVAKQIPAETQGMFKRIIGGFRGGAFIDPFRDNPPGFFGWVASGVVSHADKVANEAGFWFYKDLYDNWGTIGGTDSFSIGKFFKAHAIDLRMMNEYNNPNQFHPYVGRAVTGPQK